MFGDAPPAAPPEAKPSMSIGTGSVRVGLVLPLTASGNAGAAAQSLKNAAELAIAEFNAPDISLIVKDDGGSAQGGQQAAEQAISEGCEIILGPLFAVAVRPVGQIARQRGRAGDRLLHRRAGRLARRLSAELPAGLRRRPHRRLRRRAAPQVVRRPAARHRLRPGGGGRVPAGGGQEQWPGARARPLRRRQPGRRRWPRSPPWPGRPTACSCPTATPRRRRWSASCAPPASTPAARC